MIAPFTRPADLDARNAAADEHLGVLDGWRGLSILCVLAGHWLPLGPARWQLNDAVANTGMVMFFVLSGFLITTFLLQRHGVVEFLLRRLFRIVPLAWLFCLVVLLWRGASGHQWLAHFLFFINFPPFPFDLATAHLWSICVEMHFYLGVALLVALFGRRALWLLPLLCVAVTALRVAYGEVLSIQTQFRLDEILGGATVALIYHEMPHRLRRPPMAMLMIALLAPLLVACGHPFSDLLQYSRPYVAALLLALVLTERGSALARLLQGRVLGYIAKISYALYVLHMGLSYTWLGSGQGWAKYAKRPLLIGVTWGLAHLSTFHFEARAQALGRSLAKRWSAARSATA